MTPITSLFPVNYQYNIELWIILCPINVRKAHLLIYLDIGANPYAIEKAKYTKSGTFDENKSSVK
jgi:hypothetical protein